MIHKEKQYSYAADLMELNTRLLKRKNAAKKPMSKEFEAYLQSNDLVHPYYGGETTTVLNLLEEVAKKAENIITSSYHFDWWLFPCYTENLTKKHLNCKKGSRFYEELFNYNWGENKKFGIHCYPAILEKVSNELALAKFEENGNLTLNGKIVNKIRLGKIIQFLNNCLNVSQDALTEEGQKHYKQMESAATKIMSNRTKILYFLTGVKPIKNQVEKKSMNLTHAPKTVTKILPKL